MKALFSGMLVCFTAWASIHAQSLYPLGSGITTGGGLGVIFTDSSNGNIIAGGSFYEIDSVPVLGLASWNGNRWDSVSNPYYGDFCAGIHFQGKNYTGMGSTAIYVWDSTGGFSIPVNGSVNVLKVINGELYAAGEFDTIAGIHVNRIAKFNGSSWQGFPPMDTSSQPDTTGPILDLEYFNGELYVGGNFDINVPDMSDFCKFNGTSWQPVSPGFTAANTEVTSLEVFDNKLYVGGYFYVNQGDPADNLGVWDGSNWLALGQYVDYQVLDMEVLNNRLYLGGQFTQTMAGPCSFFSSWNGSQFRDEPDFNNIVSRLLAYQNSLYIAGPFTQADTVNANWIVEYVPPLETSIPDDAGRDGGLLIYPDPAQTYIQCQLPAGSRLYELRITDANGKLVLTLVMDSFESEGIRIPVSALSPSVYFVHVITDKGELHSKFVRR